MIAKEEGRRDHDKKSLTRRRRRKVQLSLLYVLDYTALTDGVRTVPIHRFVCSAGYFIEYVGPTARKRKYNGGWVKKVCRDDEVFGPKITKPCCQLGRSKTERVG